MPQPQVTYTERQRALAGLRGAALSAGEHEALVGEVVFALAPENKWTLDMRCWASAEQVEPPRYVPGTWQHSVSSSEVMGYKKRLGPDRPFIP